MKLWPYFNSVTEPPRIKEPTRDWRMLELEHWKNVTEDRITKLEAIVDIIQARREAEQV